VAPLKGRIAGFFKHLGRLGERMHTHMQVRDEASMKENVLDNHLASSLSKFETDVSIQDSEDALGSFTVRAVPGPASGREPSHARPK
jgi:hypothetical protein